MKMNRVLALILSSVMICIAVPGEVMAAEDSMEELGIDDGEEARQEAISAEEVEDNLEIEDESSVDENQTLSVDDDQEFDDGSNEGGDVVAFSDEENKNREVIANGTENELINWMVYDTGELIISGSGDMTDYDVNNLPPWYKYRKNITNVTVENDISSIGSYAFYSLYKLNFVDIKSQCVNVRDHSFEKCTKLISINISERVTSIGANAFSGCSSLASINIPEEVTFIGSNAFSECSSLTSINIPEKVTFIGGSAFSECSSLASINIPEGVTSIDDWTFYGCSSLTSINIPEGVTSIGDNAFSGCSSLISINIPKTVCSIEDSTFERCEKLRSIRYSGSKDEWDTLKVNIYAGNPTIYYNYNPKHKHLYQLKVLNPSTCVTKGIGEQVCTLCGDFYEEEIKATGHKEVKDAAVAATCETNGKTEGSHCSVCDEVLKEQTEVPALGHNWDSGKITKAATCTEAGVKTYTCTRCQKTKTEEIKATGHKEVKDAAVAATCEKAGKTEGSHCSVCGKVIKAQKEVPVLGHSWDAGKITKAATCTETGVKTHTCIRCQKTKTEEVKATGHKFSAWKTSSKATIYSPAKQTRECTSCHKKQTRDTGKKLKAAIKVSVSKITMQPQQKLGTLKVTFANGDSVKAWKSSNPNIFKVVGKTNGKCTLTAGKIAGTAKLTIKLKSGLTKDVSITVKSVKTTKISGVKSVITLKVKKTTTLKPVLAPKNSTEKITYKSSNSKIVTVNAAGKVVAKKKGTAYIYVKSGSKTVTCKVVVK